MKAWHAAVLLGIGIPFLLLGFLFKIQHWPGALLLMLIGGNVSVIGLALIVHKALRHGGRSDFWNS
ncbi:MAG: hypothetical protein IPJ76_03245 [Flavobacteriales bacterium]|nr:MAG: hypothetical protein IPJ76_03245 [Flavobacteriales bacterium]